MVASPRVRTLLLLCLVLSTPIALAQQTGAIHGTVTASDGSVLPGVTVEAKSNVLPQPRIAITDAKGEYRLPALVPGMYTLQFALAGMQPAERRAQVLLGQDIVADAQLGVAGVAESITVTAEATLVDKESTAIKSGISEEVIQRVPVGQEYRDLLRLAPAVQINEAEIRGPSAGGSEQDNVYLFDGVNVTLPLFGTLAAEPSSHDIAQVSIIKGGAKAVDFNRSAGLTIDSASKSGTNQWLGELKAQVQTDALTSEAEGVSTSKYDEARSWTTANFGGPVLRDRLFFYSSYYRPTRARDNISNLYGPVPDFDSSRNEYFGKLTLTPSSSLLFNGSYRDSRRSNEAASIGGAEAASVSVGEESKQKVGILEGSWIVNSRSLVTFKYNDYRLLTSALPDNLLGVIPSATVGTQLDINNLDQMGYFSVPLPRTGTTAADLAYNAFVAPLIAKYGFPGASGAKVGGGAVGGYFQINDQDFFRRSAQLAYDFSFGGDMSHDIHVGYQRYVDREELARFSNGWGSIIVPFNVKCPTGTACAGQPVAFQTDFQRSTEGTIGGQVIESEFISHNFEINDTIRWGNWSFNVGVLASNDTLYGEGLAEADNIAGFISSPGKRYKMHEIEWDQQIQPRLGATWSYNGQDTVYAAYAKYFPAASSLPRAASWDRNTLGLVTRAFFDATGKLIGSQQVAASSGKLFQEGIEPRYTDEFLIGTSQQLNNQLTGRMYARYRYATNFWEDTNNNARIDFRPPEGIPRQAYIPNLGAVSPPSGLRGAIGSGSTYVIAELDGAFTKYYEATLETDYNRGNAFVRGSYTWSHYYGNFDQDNTSTTYDFATFIGSSNIADGGGRQLWDNKYGDLHGDRRHLAKFYGWYNLPWNASVGALTLYQSGHAWEAWSWEPYGPAGQNIIGTSRSDTNRYAEPAGRRRTDPHYQLDLNYTQHWRVSRLDLQFLADVYNIFDRQTGYSPQPASHSALFGLPRLRHSPRRVQLALRVQF